MRKASIKLECGRSHEAFIIIDRIISEIDSICASPRERRADLLMNYRGKLQDRRSAYYEKMIAYKEVLNIED